LRHLVGDFSLAGSEVSDGAAESAAVNAAGSVVYDNFKNV
jgi:hypothetical protein